jgi:uncharacterized membrane protein YfcA
MGAIYWGLILLLGTAVGIAIGITTGHILTAVVQGWLVASVTALALLMLFGRRER